MEVRELGMMGWIMGVTELEDTEDGDEIRRQWEAGDLSGSGASLPPRWWVIIVESGLVGNTA